MRQLVQNVQTQAAANPPGKGNNRKPLCESRSVTNLKTLGSKKEDFNNWNEKLINATTQVFGYEWRSFVKRPNEKFDIDRSVMAIAEVGQLPFARQVPEPLRCNE